MSLIEFSLSRKVLQISLSNPIVKIRYLHPKNNLYSQMYVCEDSQGHISLIAVFIRLDAICGALEMFTIHSFFCVSQVLDISNGDGIGASMLL